jgi:hypothetical protein
MQWFQQQPRELSAEGNHQINGMPASTPMMTTFNSFYSFTENNQ